MNESNISRDHIALEAMKIILDKSIKQRITPVQRIRKLAGLRYEVRSFFIHNPGNVADYEIVSVSKTAIMDVFHYKEKEASHGE